MTTLAVKAWGTDTLTTPFHNVADCEGIDPAAFFLIQTVLNTDEPEETARPRSSYKSAHKVFCDH
ncbi:hypothetical protein [Ruegeria halocynthiae]|uniref:hypothetical protein n=1 Tax=Ruegeria halocynthiae TaxID=985054 RepID=UPI000AC0EF9D|nr:hypothetical protein [Ruegeria halocynthiae]